jgi:hypothetical protein
MVMEFKPINHESLNKKTLLKISILILLNIADLDGSE